MSNKDLVKQFINKAGVDIILQSIIEMMDDNIDATDYDIDSVCSSDDIWKFKVIEGLEHAYEAYLGKTDNHLLENNHES